MKYQVMYDNKSRLRVRSGQWAFTKEEGYGLASLLSNQCFIHEVYTSHRNGSILIYYDGNAENSWIQYGCMWLFPGLFQRQRRGGSDTDFPGQQRDYSPRHSLRRLYRHAGSPDG